MLRCNIPLKSTLETTIVSIKINRIYILTTKAIQIYVVRLVSIPIFNKEKSVTLYNKLVFVNLLNAKTFVHSASFCININNYNLKIDALINVQINLN